MVSMVEVRHGLGDRSRDRPLGSSTAWRGEVTSRCLSVLSVCQEKQRCSGEEHGKAHGVSPSCAITWAAT